MVKITQQQTIITKQYRTFQTVAELSLTNNVKKQHYLNSKHHLNFDSLCADCSNKSWQRYIQSFFGRIVSK